MRIELSIGFGDVQADVRIDAPAETALADVRSALADVVGAPADLPLWCGTDPLPAGTPLGDPRLRTGVRLRFGAAPCSVDRAPVLALHVAGGPAAGVVAPLERGRLTIGRASDNDVVLPDADVSRRHAVVDVTTTSITLRDAGSSNGTWLGGRRVPPAGAPLHVGDLVRVGDSLLRVAGPSGPPATVHRATDGSLALRRSLRHRADTPAQVITMPTDPAHPRPRGVQWITVLLPAAAGAVVAWAYDQPAFLLFALLTPAMLISTAVGDRLHWRRARRRAATALRRRRADADRQIERELTAETARRRRAAPDPAAVGCAVAVPDTQVWSRQRGDPDLLQVRLGTADLPATLAVRTGDLVAPAGRLLAVPLCVDLADGPLGMAGPAGIVTACARWLIGQLAALTAPADVEFALLFAPAREPTWHWARWLPHVRHHIATSAAALVADLAALVDRRSAAHRLGERTWSGSWLVVVVDRLSGGSDLVGLADVLVRGSGLGITALWLEVDPAALPGCCAATVRVSGINGTRAALGGSAGGTELVLDLVSTGWADELARNLAPLVDAGSTADGEVPTACRLRDVLRLAAPTPQAIVARWAESAGTARTVLGKSGSGATAQLDLGVDGPHVLVAGTTGSGKSELLRTVVIGLAVNQPPGELNLLLIDYKGGAAFADCARLPHAAGLVTDLDAGLAERALRCLHAELRRREQLFAVAGVADLADYRAGRPSQPIPRLVIVVDEFAALAEEFPDFVPRLIGVAQRGRSLGVHLVLATQRPGTAVSADIRANTAVRIALRVTDASESLDVIDSPLAASVDPARPGLGYLRAGPSLTAFQAAHASATGRPDSSTPRVEALDSWRRARVRVDPDEPTDLAQLVEAIRGAAQQAGAPPARSPWPPPLPDRLPRAALPPAPRRQVIQLGRVDLPDEQRQETLHLDLGAGASVLAAGGSRTGRTSTLTLVALGAAAALPPQELHLQVVDATGELAGRLRPLAHAMTVLGPAELELVPRLLARLDHAAAQRLSRGTDPAVAEPTVLVLIDGWDAVRAALPDAVAAACDDLLTGLLRTGRAARISFGVTGDRAWLASRPATAFGQRLLLGAPDRPTGHRLHREASDTSPPGRAVRCTDGAVVQLAVPATSAELAMITAGWPSAHPGPGAIRIRPLPDRVHLAALPARGALVLGVAGDDPTPVHVDPFAGARRWLVAGPPRSGRSTTLRLLAEQARGAGAAVLVAAPDASPLAEQARGLGVPVLGPNAERPATPIGRALVLVDDSEAFADTAAGDRLTEWSRDPDLPLAIVAAARAADLATSYRGVAAEVRRQRCGVLLRPGPLDGELLGARLPYRGAAGAPPGRGFAVADRSWGPLFADGDPVPIQIATPDRA